MHVDQMLFIYLLLPLSLAVYRLCPVRFRPALLLVFSALLYWSVEGINLVIPAAVIVCDCLIARLHAMFGGYKTRQNVLVAISVLKAVGIIFGFGIANQLYGVHIPLGLNVVCLTSLGYVLDIHRGFISGDDSPLRVALLCGFFPSLYAGPIATYGRMAFQYNNLQISLEKIGRGAGLFVCGLARKLILADNLEQIYRTVSAIPAAELTVLAAWSKIILLAMLLYLTLWGYCDMARGLALMFGFELVENFNTPFRATSINDFFTRFNITVNRYFRRHIYSVLGGAKGSFFSGALNILLMNILIGFWFGITPNMVVWGVYFAVFVILERYALLPVLPKIPLVLRWAYTTLVVLLSMVLFAGGDVSTILQSYAALFGFGGAGAYNNEILYLLPSNYLILLISAASVLGLPQSVSNSIKELAPGVWDFLKAVFIAVLMVLITIFLF